MLIIAVTDVNPVDSDDLDDTMPGRRDGQPLTRIGAAIAVAVALAASAASTAGEDRGDRAVATGAGALPCDVCFGQKTVMCATCLGVGSKQTTCSTCQGAGGTECRSSGCQNGLKVCRTCGGAGYTSRTIYPVRGKPYVKRSRCGRCLGKRRLPCSKCTGGLRTCEECNRRGVLARACATCSGAGTTTCARCEGSGTLPPPPLDGETVSRFRDMVESATKLVTEIRDHVDALAEIAARHVHIRGEAEKIETELSALAELVPSELPSAVGVKVNECISALEAYRTLVERHDAAFRDLEKAVAECPERVESIVAFRRLLESRLARPRVDPALPVYVEVGRHATTLERAASFVAGLRSARRQVESWATQVEGRPDEIRAAAELARQALDTREAELAEKTRALAELERDFEAIRVSASGVAAELALPVPANVRLDPSSNPGDMRVDVTIPDLDAELQSNAEEIVLTERHLQSLPRFVSGVFNASPGLSRLTVALEARVLGETGHARLERVQSFTFTRERWSRLVTGAFAADWVALLSRSSPYPAFPRAAGFSANRLLAWAIPLCCLAGVVLLVIIRVMRLWLVG